MLLVFELVRQLLPNVEKNLRIEEQLLMPHAFELTKRIQNLFFSWSSSLLLKALNKFVGDSNDIAFKVIFRLLLLLHREESFLARVENDLDKVVLSLRPAVT